MEEVLPILATKDEIVLLFSNAKRMHGDIERLNRITDVRKSPSASFEKLDRGFFQWMLISVTAGSAFSAETISTFIEKSLT